MLQLKTLMGAALLVLAPLEASAATGEQWIEDFDKAVEMARKQGKDLLVDFTGSDWCGWCIKLHEEVFAHEEFDKGVTPNFILVSLDYPRGEAAIAKVPNPERNAELKAKYGITGFPSILLMTPDGEVYNRGGYAAGGPTPYVETVTTAYKEAHEKLKASEELTKAYKGAEGQARFAILGQVADQLSKMKAGDLGVGVLKPLALEAIKLDADNAKGLQLSATKGLLIVGEYNPELQALATKLDPKNEKGVLQRAVMGQVRSVNSLEAVQDAVAALDSLVAYDNMQPMEELIILYAQVAEWCSRYVDGAKDKAKIYAQKALDMKPENPRLLQMLKGILGN